MQHFGRLVDYGLGEYNARKRAEDLFEKERQRQLEQEERAQIQAERYELNRSDRLRRLDQNDRKLDQGVRRLDQNDRKLDQGDRRLDQNDRKLDQGDERLSLQRASLYQKDEHFYAKQYADTMEKEYAAQYRAEKDAQARRDRLRNQEMNRIDRLRNQAENREISMAKKEMDLDYRRQRDERRDILKYGDKARSLISQPTVSDNDFMDMGFDMNMGAFDSFGSSFDNFGEDSGLPTDLPGWSIW